MKFIIVYGWEEARRSLKWLRGSQKFLIYGWEEAIRSSKCDFENYCLNWMPVPGLLCSRNIFMASMKSGYCLMWLSIVWYSAKSCTNISGKLDFILTKIAVFSTYWILFNCVIHAILLLSTKFIVGSITLKRC